MKLFLIMAGAVMLASCVTMNADAPQVFAKAETTPVESLDDAADDPAIWINKANPASSLILGTDKQAGLYVYDLQGETVQFLPTGRLNNVDLRQGVTISGWSGDIAAASNRTNNTIALFTIDENGQVTETGSFPSLIEEPYGLCMGALAGEVFVFVAFKTGDLISYSLTGPGGGAEAARLKLATQLEGCVFDDDMGVLYIGEEEKGIWKTAFNGSAFTAPSLVDEVSSASGVKADVEGLALYKTGERTGYLLASSQGNNSYAVYRREGENDFITRFVIADGDKIDGSEETDGIEALSIGLGPNYPEGVFVVQDGYNAPRGTPQNYKIVDFRDINALIASAEAAKQKSTEGD